jgi:hypothetical protein
MSLVGSLEDLGLGDILQIISLSRKSGVLLLRSDDGEGRFVFAEGRVTGAFCKGGPSDLRSLVVGSGATTDAEYAAAVRESQDRGVPLDDLLREMTGLAGPKLDALRIGNLERAAFAMFSWPSGEFSFDVRDDSEEVDPALCVAAGVDAQYLAMEGARLRDEEDRDADEPVDASDPASFADLRAELRDDGGSEPELEAVAVAESGDEGDHALPAEALPEAEAVVEALAADEPTPAPEPAAAASELVAEVVAEDGEDPGDAAEVVAEDVEGPGDPAEVVLEADDGHQDAAEVVALATAERFEAESPARAPQAREPEASSGPAPERVPIPLVVVDPDLALLEWAKEALKSRYERVHIFQKTELAIARIRQYLVRRETPLVILSDATPPDPNSGATSPAEIVSRLKGQVARMTVLALVPASESAAGWGVDGVARKPDPSDLYNPRRASTTLKLGEGLREAVAAAVRQIRNAGPRPSPQRAVLSRVRAVSAELREAAPRGEVIPVVLRFAAEHFARVALFLVRDEQAVGMAGRGLERAGGPDEATLRDLAMRADEPAWFRRVAESRASVRGPASDDGDRRLAALLGDAQPAEAYVAPLESGGQVVALLYADNLPDGGPLPDTAGLEIVIQEAGLILDRAALERQLAELESDV